MKYLFVPALLGLVMTGCTSSEPQGFVAAAPAMETAMPAPAAPSFNATGATGSMPAYGQQPALRSPAPTANTAPGQASSTVGFPPPPVCGPGTECTPAGVEKCRTVGSVTTCDVPPDPAADNTRYTN